MVTICLKQTLSKTQEVKRGKGTKKEPLPTTQIEY